MIDELDIPVGEKTIVNTEIVKTPEHPFIEQVTRLPLAQPGESRPKVGVPYLSASQIKKYLRCSAQYMFSYIHKIPEPTNSAVFFGSAMHEGAQAYLLTAQRSKETGPTPDHNKIKQYAKDQAVLYARTRIQLGMVWKNQWQNGPIETFDTLIESLKYGIDMMADQVWEPIIPIEIERGYLIEWKDKNVLPVLGFPDVIAETQKGPEVIDFKTGRQKKELDADLDIALSIYATAFETYSGRRTDQIGYRSFVRNRDPKIVTVTRERETRSTKRTYSIAKMMTQALQHNIYIPNDDAAKCSGCAFFEPCRDEFGQRN